MFRFSLRLRVLGGFNILLRRRAVGKQFLFPRQTVLREFQIAFRFPCVRLCLSKIR